MATLTGDDIDLCNRFRPRLMKELEELEALTADRAPGPPDQQSAGRLARMGALETQATAQETMRWRKHQRLRILRTLARMGEGEFGYCAECGDAIAEGRLNVDPTSYQCAGCAGKKS